MHQRQERQGEEQDGLVNVRGWSMGTNLQLDRRNKFQYYCIVQGLWLAVRYCVLQNIREAFVYYKTEERLTTKNDKCIK